MGVLLLISQFADSNRLRTLKPLSSDVFFSVSMKQIMTQKSLLAGLTWRARWRCY